MREWVWSKKGELCKAELNKLLSPSKFYLYLILSQVLILFLRKEKRDSGRLKLLIIISLSYRISLTLRHTGSQFLEPGIEPVPLKQEQESTARKSIVQAPSWCQYLHSLGKQGTFSRGSQRESPGMTFPRDICLLIPLRSVPTASPELQICMTSCFHAWFPGLPACP